ncbi:hypothetical protein LCGC14_0995150 [marine sediment metagenome]|uniref:Uncharacterized protein n=1 Tax=marine sediment metagenome TaxID=412755 RepID=A0A0F9NR06_9ZZZZ
MTIFLDDDTDMTVELEEQIIKGLVGTVNEHNCSAFINGNTVDELSPVDIDEDENSEGE